jgi:hypothetical protein
MTGWDYLAIYGLLIVAGAIILPALALTGTIVRDVLSFLEHRREDPEPALREHFAGVRREHLHLVRGDDR